MCHLFETIKIVNGKVFNLEYHQKRVDESYKRLYSSTNHYNLKNLIKSPQQLKKSLVKCKFIYDNRDFSIEYSPYKKRIISKLKLIKDNDISYDLKYLNRSLLLRCLEQKGYFDDIIIVKNGLITDTSFSNLIFFDGDTWYTPSSYLLNGTCRQRLLKTGRINEKKITINNFRDFYAVKLINAMLDIDDCESIPISSIFE